MTQAFARVSAIALLAVLPAFALVWPVGQASAQGQSTKAISPQAQAAQDFEAGVAAAKAGELTQAIELFTKALDSDALNDSDRARVFNNRGATYRRMGKPDEAVDDFSRAIRLRPQYFRAHLNRGVANGDLGEFEDAEEDYKEAIKLRPEEMATFMERAKTRAQSGRLDTAILDLNEVLRVQPRNRAALILRGQYLRSQGLYDRAMADFSAAIELKVYRIPSGVRLMRGPGG